jgi:DNA-directed RNA polymerase specialized sigma24 family protein
MAESARIELDTPWPLWHARRAIPRRVRLRTAAEDIYNFSVKIHGVPVIAQRILCRRLRGPHLHAARTFEGRGGMQLRTFLAYHVLRGLFLDWQRTERELETVSLSQPIGDADRTLEDVVAIAEEEPETEPRVAAGPAAAVCASLEPEEQLDLKLLSHLEQDLTPADVRLLAQVSHRPLGEAVALVAEVQATLRRKDERLALLTEELDSTWGWLSLRRRELQEIDEKMRLMEPDHDDRTREQLLERRKELATAIEKRSRQRERLLEDIRDFKVTTSYKDIARLKDSSVGTVCSRIFRLRQRLEGRWQEAEVGS